MVWITDGGRRGASSLDCEEPDAYLARKVPFDTCVGGVGTMIVREASEWRKLTLPSSTAIADVIGDWAEAFPPENSTSVFLIACTRSDWGILRPQRRTAAWRMLRGCQLGWVRSAAVLRRLRASRHLVSSSWLRHSRAVAEAGQ